jgi:hypothetical protein
MKTLMVEKKFWAGAVERANSWGLAQSATLRLTGRTEIGPS